MRLTKRNPETGLYEYIEKAKTQEEFIAQRKAVIQKLGELEDMATRYMVYSDGRIERIPPAEGEWKDHWEGKYANPTYECSLCGKVALDRASLNVLMSIEHIQVLSPYCPHCGARMKGADDEQG